MDREQFGKSHKNWQFKKGKASTAEEEMDANKYAPSKFAKTRITVADDGLTGNLQTQGGGLELGPLKVSAPNINAKGSADKETVGTAVKAAGIGAGNPAAALADEGKMLPENLEKNRATGTKYTGKDFGKKNVDLGSVFGGADESGKNPAVIKSPYFEARGSGRPSVGIESHHMGMKMEDKKK